MIPLSVDEIASTVGGKVVGDGAATVSAPAVIDGREARPGSLFVAFVGEHTDGHEHASQAATAGAVAVLGTRPTALPTVVVDDVQKALQRLAVHVVARLRDGLTVVAVTGSQGKTSTKDMIAAVLSASAPTVATVGSFNNEIGVPLTMLRAEVTTRFLVLEMGARHLGDIAALTDLVAPDIAVVTNLGRAHLGEFGSREAIGVAKSELVRGMVSGGTAVLSADDPGVRAMGALTDGPVLAFGAAGAADVRVRDLTLDRLGRPSFTLQHGGAEAVAELPLVGAHWALNAAAAVGAGLAGGVPLGQATAAVQTAAISKWRMEVLTLANGAMLLDDSYNANPESTRAALDALAAVAGDRRIAVLGEMLELGEAGRAAHHEIGTYAATRADLVVTIGAAAAVIADGAGERSLALPDNAAASDWLQAHLVPGDVVLVKASRGARLDEVVAEVIATGGTESPWRRTSGRRCVRRSA